MLRVTTRSVRRYLRELALVTEVESRRGAARAARTSGASSRASAGARVALRRTQAYALLAPRRVFEVLQGLGALRRDRPRAAPGRAGRAPARRARPATRGDAPGDAHLEDRFAYVPPLAARVRQPQRGRRRGVPGRGRARRVLRFRYREEAGDGAARGARITAHPYALVLHGGTITCVAHDVRPRRDARLRASTG